MTRTRPNKHIPLRRCVVCRQQRPQAQLLRFAKDAQGNWRYDRQRRAGGRGAWLCADTPEHYQLKALKRFFRGQGEAVLEQLPPNVRANQHNSQAHCAMIEDVPNG